MCHIGVALSQSATGIFTSDTSDRQSVLLYAKHIFVRFIYLTLIDGILNSRHLISFIDVQTVSLLSDRNIYVYREYATSTVKDFLFRARSPISNVVYEFCPVTSRVLDKNRLLGPARSEGISMRARIVPTLVFQLLSCTTARTVFRTLIDM